MTPGTPNPTGPDPRPARTPSMIYDGPVPENSTPAQKIVTGALLGASFALTGATIVLTVALRATKRIGDPAISAYERHRDTVRLPTPRRGDHDRPPGHVAAAGRFTGVRRPSRQRTPL